MLWCVMPISIARSELPELKFPKIDELSATFRAPKYTLPPELNARNRQVSSRAFIFAAGRPKRFSRCDSGEVQSRLPNRKKSMKTIDSTQISLVFDLKMSLQLLFWSDPEKI